MSYDTTIENLHKTEFPLRNVPQHLLRQITSIDGYYWLSWFLIDHEFEVGIGRDGVVIDASREAIEVSDTVRAELRRMSGLDPDRNSDPIFA